VFCGQETALPADTSSDNKSDKYTNITAIPKQLQQDAVRDSRLHPGAATLRNARNTCIVFDSCPFAPLL